MPVIQGSVTFSRFIADGDRPSRKDPRRSLARCLRNRAFEPLDDLGEQDRATGWVELHDHHRTDLAPSRFLFGSHLLVSYRVDTRRVPAAVVKRALDAWSTDFESRRGKPPTRTDKATQKELILKKLRKQAFPSSRAFDVAWNQDTQEVTIWAPSRKMVDETQVAFEETFELTLRPRNPGHLVEALTDAELDRIDPTPELFGADVVQEARGRGGA